MTTDHNPCVKPASIKDAGSVQPGSRVVSAERLAEIRKVCYEDRVLYTYGADAMIRDLLAALDERERRLAEYAPHSEYDELRANFLSAKAEIGRLQREADDWKASREYMERVEELIVGICKYGSNDTGTRPTTRFVLELRQERDSARAECVALRETLKPIATHPSLSGADCDRACSALTRTADYEGKTVISRERLQELERVDAAIKRSGCQPITDEALGTLRHEQDRLDWLDTQQAVSFGRPITTPEEAANNMELGPSRCAIVLKIGLGTHKRTFWGETARAAIDAAMSDAQKGGETP